MRKERPFSPLLYAPLTPTERTKRTTMYVDPDARGFVLPSTLSASLGEYLLTSALLSPKPFTPWATLPTHEEAIEALRFRLAIAPGAAITCTLDYDGYRCICWHAALGAIFTTTNGQPSGQTITAACAAPVLSSIRKQLDEAYSQTKTALRSAGADNPSSGVVTFTDANQLETPIGKQWAIDALRSLLPEYYENENTAQPYGLDPAEIGGARKPTKETADALNASIRAVLRESMYLQGLHILLCSAEAMPAIDTGLLGALSGAVCRACMRAGAACERFAQAINTAQKNTAGGKRGARSIADALQEKGITLEQFSEECLQFYEAHHMRGKGGAEDTYNETAAHMRKKYGLERFNRKACENLCIQARKARNARQTPNN